jgi:hypothetical protein
MSEPLSLSILTIEVDRKPLLAFAAVHGRFKYPYGRK